MKEKYYLKIKNITFCLIALIFMSMISICFNNIAYAETIEVGSWDDFITNAVETPITTDESGYTVYKVIKDLVVTNPIVIPDASNVKIVGNETVEFNTTTHEATKGRTIKPKDSYGKDYLFQTTVVAGSNSSTNLIVENLIFDGSTGIENEALLEFKSTGTANFSNMAFMNAKTRGLSIRGNATVSNCMFYNNGTEENKNFVRSLYFNGIDNTRVANVNDCYIFNNISSSVDNDTINGVIYCATGTFNMNRCKINKNKAINSCGIITAYGSKVNIYQSEIKDNILTLTNEDYRDQGTIYNYYSRCTIEETSILNNSSKFGSIIHSVGYSTQMINCNASGNASESCPIYIAFDNREFILDGGDYSNNKANYTAMFLGNLGKNTVVKNANIFNHNDDNKEVNLIYNQDTITLIDNHIYDNITYSSLIYTARGKLILNGGIIERNNSRESTVMLYGSIIDFQKGEIRNNISNIAALSITTTNINGYTGEAVNESLATEYATIFNGAVIKNNATGLKTEVYLDNYYYDYYSEFEGRDRYQWGVSKVKLGNATISNADPNVSSILLSEKSDLIITEKITKPLSIKSITNNSNEQLLKFDDSLSEEDRDLTNINFFLTSGIEGVVNKTINDSGRILIVKEYSDTPKEEIKIDFTPKEYSGENMTITKDDVDLSKILQTIKGIDRNLDITFTDSINTIDKSNFIISNIKNTNVAGEASFDIIFVGIPEITGTITYYFDVVCDLSNNIGNPTLSNYEFYFTNEEITPRFKVKAGNRFMEDDEYDLEFLGSNYTDVGTKTVKVIGKGRFYKNEKEVTYTVKTKKEVKEDSEEILDGKVITRVKLNVKDEDIVNKFELSEDEKAEDQVNKVEIYPQIEKKELDTLVSEKEKVESKKEDKEKILGTYDIKLTKEVTKKSSDGGEKVKTEIQPKTGEKVEIELEIPYDSKYNYDTLKMLHIHEGEDIEEVTIKDKKIDGNKVKVKLDMEKFSLLIPIAELKQVSSGTTGTGDTKKVTMSTSSSSTGEVHKPYISGYKDGTFKPNNAITRAEIATMLAKIDPKFDNGVLYSSNLSDIKEGYWAKNYIGYCEKINVIKGYTDKTYKPNNSIKISELATILVKFKNLKISNAKTGFKDAQGRWMEANISTLENLGYLDRYDKNTLDIDRPATRAEACALINKVLGRSIDSKELKTINIQTKFKDVYEEDWYYADVVEATNLHKKKPDVK